MEFYLAGEITQVIDSIPWVRCASGNVSSQASSALVVGCGGLGCPAAAYLAGAGSFAKTPTFAHFTRPAESVSHQQCFHKGP